MFTLFFLFCPNINNHKKNQTNKQKIIIKFQNNISNTITVTDNLRYFFVFVYHLPVQEMTMFTVYLFQFFFFRKHKQIQFNTKCMH